MLSRLRTWHAQARSNVATIDMAKAAPFAPVAPIDLSDRGEVTGVLEIAARIGEYLVAAGTTNSDAAAQVKGITEAFGLWYVHVDMTHNLIRLFANVAENRRDPVIVVRVITPTLQNFHSLSVVDRLIRDINQGGVDPATAQRRLDALDARPIPMSKRWLIGSWSLLGGAVTFLIGGGIWAALLSILAAATIVWMNEVLSKQGLPYFFQNVLGGVFASLLAAAAYHLGGAVGVALRPSLVIASCIIAMLAGLTLVQALQNMVTSAPISGTARFFDALINTAGIVAGVGIGITIAAMSGYSLPPLEATPSPNFASTTVRVAGSVAATMTFARGCFANWRTVGIAGLSALIGSSLYYYVLTPMAVPYVMASALTAIVIGLFGGLLSRYYAIPPLITAISGVTPLLPGLSIYRGMYGLLHDQLLIGFSSLTVALITATALSAGVVFGEWVARRLRRPPKLRTYAEFARKMRKRQRPKYQ